MKSIKGRTRYFKSVFNWKADIKVNINNSLLSIILKALIIEDEGMKI